MIAFTRAVSPSIDRCELTHVAREPIEAGLADAQHLAYERALADGGCEVRRLPPLPEQPDAVFVEDAAVVLDEVAVIARPGAASRRAEVESVAAALRPLRRLGVLESPATLDGGDVLPLGRTVWVGASQRTNPAGHERLRALLEPLGYRVRVAPVNGCLHLKSAVTAVGSDTLLLNPEWTDAAVFDGVRLLEVDPAEPWAANALRLPDRVLLPAAAHRTRRRLEANGFAVVPVEISELTKAEAGLTCCSLLVPHGETAGRPGRGSRP